MVSRSSLLGSVLACAILLVGRSLAQEASQALTQRDVAVEVKGSLKPDAEASKELLALWNRIEHGRGEAAAKRSSYEEPGPAPGSSTLEAELAAERDLWRRSVRQLASFIKRHAGSTAALNGKLLLAKLLAEGTELAELVPTMLAEIQREHEGSCQALAAKILEMDRPWVREKEGPKAYNDKCLQVGKAAAKLFEHEPPVSDDDRAALQALGFRASLRACYAMSMARFVYNGAVTKDDYRRARELYAQTLIDFPSEGSDVRKLVASIVDSIDTMLARWKEPKQE